MKKKILILGIVIVVSLIGGYFLLEHQAPTQPAEELKLELIQGEIKQVSFVSAKMWVIQASDGDMYMPIGNKSQDLIKLGEGTKVKVKGYITKTEIIIPEAGESNTYTQKAINIISYEKRGE